MSDNTLKYALLEDNSIDISKEDFDLLNHKQYVDLLSEIVRRESSDNNIETIALVGSWGAGKTSIIKAFVSNIKNTKLNGLNVRSELYNAWKYSKDDFRKSFLLDAEECISERLKLEKRIYQEVTSSSFIFSQNKYINCIFIAFVITLILFACICGIDTVGNWIQIILDALGISIIVATGYCLKIIISQKQTTIIKQFSTHDFSTEFNEIIKRSDKFNVFIIDDLDRCKPEQALDILEIIQGYLKDGKRNNHMFIVPIDQERLTSYLKEERNYNDTLATEYFNKIFDIKIELQSLSRINLFEMLKTINNKFSYNLSNNALSIIADYLVSTPRDVKKHLNNINLQRSLLKNNKEKEYIEDEQIIKLYILKNVWREYYKHLIDKYNTVDDINSFLVNEFSKSEDLVFKKFLLSTKSIDITPILEYEYQKAETKPDDNLIIAIYESNYTYIEKYVHDASDVNNVCNALEYMYRIYIVERELVKEYIWPIAAIYMWLLNNYVELQSVILDCIKFNEITKSITAANDDYTEEEREKLTNENDWDKINSHILLHIEKYSHDTNAINNIETIIDMLIATMKKELLCKMVVYI